MSKKAWGGWVVAVALAATAEVRANEWNPSAGLTFVSGFSDVVDWYEDALDADASWAVPIGLSLGVSFEFFRQGVVGLGVELAYDGSTLDMVNGDELKPGGVLFSVRAVF